MYIFFFYTEPSIVHIELYNPLQIAVSLSEIILGCKHRNSTMANKDPINADAYSDENMIEGTPIEESDNMFAFDEFNLQKIPQLSLDPLEKRVVIIYIYYKYVYTKYTDSDLILHFPLYLFLKIIDRINSCSTKRRIYYYCWLTLYT